MAKHNITAAFEEHLVAVTALAEAEAKLHAERRAHAEWADVRQPEIAASWDRNFKLHAKEIEQARELNKELARTVELLNLLKETGQVHLKFMEETGTA